MSHAAFLKALAFFKGNRSAMARAAKTSQQRISYILDHENALPPELVLPIAEATGMPPHELRADIYPRERVRRRRKAA
jgi:DNA-binding transcriptional regulator YdaS (Cro superfamily)